MKLAWLVTLGKRGLVLLMLIIASGGDFLTAQAGAAPSASPEAGGSFDPASFGGAIDNRYMPLLPGTTYVYEGVSDGVQERDEVTVTNKTKSILGVVCVVVEDRVFAEGQLTEGTLDWYAQDTSGNVWYFGEDTSEYENGTPSSTAGSWQAGVDGAEPGIVMLGQPSVGATYQQEYYPGEAEDMAEVISLGETIDVPYGSFDDVLVTHEWTPLEPDVEENKYYAPGVGVVFAELTKGGQEQVKLVVIQTESATPVATPEI